MHLKIKDNIDLKELVRYNFTFNDDNGIWSTKIVSKGRGAAYITVKSWNRKVELVNMHNHDVDPYALVKVHELKDIVEVLNNEKNY